MCNGVLTYIGVGARLMPGFVLIYVSLITRCLFNKQLDIVLLQIRKNYFNKYEIKSHYIKKSVNYQPDGLYND